jgi:hypothetical protein
MIYNNGIINSIIPRDVRLLRRKAMKQKNTTILYQAQYCHNIPMSKTRKNRSGKNFLKKLTKTGKRAIPVVKTGLKTVGKTAKVVVEKSLTKTNNISKSNKEP